MSDDLNIIDSVWFKGVIGIVSVDYPRSGYWQAYIGLGDGINKGWDIIHIADLGDKLTWQQAQVFFPNVDITKYKTFPKHDHAGPLIDHDKFQCAICHIIIKN